MSDGGLPRRGTFLRHHFASIFLLLAIVLCYVLIFFRLFFFSISTAADGTLQSDSDQNRIPMWREHVNPTENKVIYVGMFGLGHRLSKLAAAYHLIRISRWPVNWLEIIWGSCDNRTTSNDNLDIFTYLFNNNQIHVDTFSHNNDRDLLVDCGLKSGPSACYNQGKSLVIRNDVPGYYAGQVYKNARIPLPRLPLASWEDKIHSDAFLFRNLLAAFEHKHGAKTILPFQNKHDWQNRFVIGLHIRAGNGEREHFQEARRQINHLMFYENLRGTVLSFLADPQNNPLRKEPLIFLATDTASVVEVLRELLAAENIPVVTVQQPRVAQNQGVSYSAWTAGSKQCWQGWLYSMVDMALLARSNVLIAAQRSTFSQILPRAILLDQLPPDNQQGLLRFCEVDEMGKSMTCFANTNSWLLRENSGPQYRAARTFGASNFSVTHKVMVHFPDTDFQHLSQTIDDDLEWQKQARAFLSISQQSNRRLLYGTKIAKKYRSHNSFQENWALL